MEIDRAKDRTTDACSIESGQFEITRREFISTVAVATGALAFGTPLTDTRPVSPQDASDKVALEVLINGQKHQLTLDPRVTLLDLLREQLGFTGTKKGCDHGQCGACTVLANGRRINSCLSLAVS